MNRELYEFIKDLIETIDILQFSVDFDNATDWVDAEKEAGVE
jgi:hypothetical protein